ncbi:Sedoheptulose 1,7-bisphosphatase [Ceratocystis fimbriata CBS 114723]|uniref:Sedoheptulose 1,7-bisphosphatase n=1 Tax=Ceratocystis fimbriata CBS 114723 TaxID=1035309 RepID=A0A2C5WZH4_9PEZI|nr:Sedoheptulose 1,7-bisphosphatase [Ceratocystis fimbriata CBS 114723]
MPTPRLFIIRHGETEWSLDGRHTSHTDIPLTPNGEKRVRATGRALVGRDRLIVPNNLAHIYVSPRRRAQRTFELLNVGSNESLPWLQHGIQDEERDDLDCKAKIEVTSDVREWDYGDYEGITSKQIREQREKEDIPGQWDIWADGCPGGESPHDITSRLDRLITEIRDKWHKPAMQSQCQNSPAGDVLIVAHGHILRALAMRWVGAELEAGPAFILQAGGVGTLSYEHDNIHEPAILLGSAFTVE